MRGKLRQTGSAGDVLRDALTGRPVGPHARGNRVPLNLSVEPRVKDIIAKRASDAAISQAELVSDLVLYGASVIQTDYTSLAKPLVAISYHLARALQAQSLDETRVEIAKARAVVVESLAPLQRGHDSVMRAREDDASRWNG